MKRVSAAAMILAGIVLMGACGGGGASEPVDAPLADAPQRPMTEWDEIAQAGLLDASDLDGYELAPQSDYSVPDDVVIAECAEVDQLDERYGPSTTAWGIGYVRPPSPTESEVRLGHSVLVWESDNVAVPRMSDAISVIGPCRQAQIRHNFEAQGAEQSLEVVDSQLLDVDVPEIPQVATDGYRVRLVASLGGLEFPIYYDFLLVAKDHVIAVVDLASQVRPVPAGEQAEILGAVADRLIRAQQ